MLRRTMLAAGTALAARPSLAAPAGGGPVVVELFTSQSCSSCPPADALLAALARERADVLALSFHVTYWDRLGWKDRFSLPEATDRQRRYAATLRAAGGGDGTVYTPQAVVQGRRDAIGSDRAAVLGAIAAARPAGVPLAVAALGSGLAVEAGADAAGQDDEGALWMVGFDRQHATAVAGGENGGRRLVHANVVRSLAPLGTWTGRALRLDAPRPAGERVAVLLQAPDGRILGAASA